MKRKRIFILLLALLATCGVWAEPTWTVSTSIGTKDTFVVTRSESTYAQTVFYRTVNLSAYAGQHYTAVNGTLTFGIGETVKKVAVTRTTPGTDAYKYQNDNTTRSYRFEVTDQGGFYLASKDFTFTTGTSFSADKVSQSITNLVYFNSGSNYTSGVNSSKYVDVSYTPPSGQVESSGTLNGYVLIDDSYDYAQKAATVSTSSLISTTGADAAYLNDMGCKIYATVCFTEKEKDDGYQYIQIVAGNGSTSYDTGYDPDGAVNNPANSAYKVCFELSTGSNAEGKQFFPHRYNTATGTNEFSLSDGKLWQQKFKSSGHQATNSGSLVFNTNVENITTRFDAGGKDNDTWGYKDLFVRMALVDATAPTKLAVSVAPGKHCKGDTVYVSVAFNEIVTVTGTPKLTTTSANHWGDLNYIAGDGTNVLTFSATIPDNASGNLNITGLSGTVKDLAGNSLIGSSVTATNLCSLDASYAYSISYNLNGGSVATSSPATYTWETANFTLNNPTRTGYTFLGWTGSNGNTPITSVSIANHSHGDKSYTANWTPITYTLTYNLAGGSASNPTSYTIESNITLVNPTRAGYDFVGWTGTGLDEPTMSVTIADSIGDRSYTATWTLHIYAINYDLDGGSAANPTSYTIETPTFTLNNPTRTGYTFEGWTGDGSGMSVTITQGTTGELNYQANWTEHTYTIHFMANVSGGIPVVPVNPDITDIPYSSQFNLPSADAVFTRTGYYLYRWTTEPDGSGTAYTDGQEVSMLSAKQDGTVTLYAQWEVIPWTGDGDEDYPYIITYASQLVKLANGDSYEARYFKLGNDIDMRDVGEFTPIGLGTIGNSFTSFQGHFDGDGKTIRNLTINRPDNACNGLFGYVEYGSVSNVVIDSANVSGSGSTGCVVGTLNNGTVSHCVVKNSTVTCEWSGLGAIVGNSNGGHIDSNYYHNCVRTYNGVTSSVNIGVNGADRDGARSVHSLTLPAHVTASSDETVVIDEVTYYASNVAVTLGYTDLPRHFDVSYNYNDGSDHALAGNSFTMPAAAVTVSAPITPDLATWWHADEDHDGTTEARAYIISDTTGLNLLSTLVKGVDGYPGNDFQGQYFKLGNDIIYNYTTDWDDTTSTENNYTPIGQCYVGVNGYLVSKYFRGNFDGDHHTISGIRMYKNSTTADNGSLGLFGITIRAIVKNVTLSDARITGETDVAGIVGAMGGTVENCHVTSSVAIHAVVDNAQNHGGVVGDANGDTIIGCSSAATLTVAHGLTGCECYGGILGRGYAATRIRDCFVYGATIPHLHITTCCEDYDASGAIVGKIKRVSYLRNNYYYGVTIGDATTGIGIGHEEDAEDNRHDITTNDAAVPIYSVTLGEHVTATPATTMAFDNKVCYKAGTDVTLQSEGCIITGPYKVTDAQGNNIAVSGGNVFTMPACDVTANASLMGGSGTSQDPYIISTPEELVALSDYTNAGYSTRGKHFLMANDIDMSGVANFAPIGRHTSFYDYHPFQGTFDGGNHTIKHLTIDDATSLVTGLFGEMNYPACVKRLTLDSASIRGAHDVGGIAGRSNGESEIDSCRVNNSSFYTEENAHLGAIVCQYNYSYNNMNDNYYYNCSVNGSYAPTGIGTSDGDKTEFSQVFAMPITDISFEIEAGQWQAIATPFIIDNYFPFSTDLTEGVYDLLSYNEYQARWKDCRNDTNFIFENGRGYIYRSATSGTRTMQGVPLRAKEVAENGAGGPLSIDLSASAYCDDAALRGFNLLGNPNDAPIDLQSAQEYLAGYYTLTPDGTWQPHLLSDPIAAGQAFLVQVSRVSYITIPLQSGGSKGVRASEDQSALHFEVSNGKHSDVAYAILGTRTSSSANESLRKFGHMEEGLPTLSIVRGDEHYAIAALGDTTQAFNMAFTAAPGEYTLALSSFSSSTSYLHLIDKVAARDIDLLRDSTYTFTATGNDADRFLIKLSPNAQEPPSAHFAHQQGNEIIVTGEGTLEAYDVMGRKLFSEEVSGFKFQVPRGAFPGTGVYVLRLGEKTQKIVVK